MKCSGGCGKELGNDWVLKIEGAKQFCEDCSKPFAPKINKIRVSGSNPDIKHKVKANEKM